VGGFEGYGEATYMSVSVGGLVDDELYHRHQILKVVLKKQRKERVLLVLRAS